METQRIADVAALTGTAASCRNTRRKEQRRSPRVKLRAPIPCFLSGYGSAAIQTVSLGGATIVSSFRPARQSPAGVRFLYDNGCVDARVFVYRTVVQELFYSDVLGSRVRFLSSVRFDNPSVPTLNLLYRIIGDFWVDAGDDDTERYRDELTTC